MHSSTKILLALAFALVALGTLLLTCSASVFVQLFIALALAYILNPAVLLLEKRGMGRVAGILTVFGAALLLVFLRSLGDYYRGSAFYQGAS